MLFRLVFILSLLLFSVLSYAEVTVDNKPNTDPVSNLDTEDEEKESPWLATPLITSDPKLGTTLGALVAYMHHFDDVSPVSMIGLSGIYSNTDSFGGNIFGNLYFDEDRQRLLTFIGAGLINNEYSYDREDGQELQLNTSDNIKAAFIRYSHRVYGDWFIGGQIVKSNYVISGSDPGSDFILDLLDLVGFDSTAIGLVGTYDSRDNQQSASSGQNFVFHQFAYRESFGGDESFDAYQLDYSTYHAYAERHVLGTHVKARWTHDAPNSGFSSMELRGYVRGQYLAEHATYVEVEERYSLTETWGLRAFTGVGCLYGDNLSGGTNKCSNSDNLYPNIGGGVAYALKPEEKVMVRAEVALGKEGNYGFYLQFGESF